MRANPYVLTFDDDADGGPEHVLWRLLGFVCSFRKDGETIATGSIEIVDNDKVTVAQWNEESGLHDGEMVTLDIFGDFDEVVYH
jgi:hypothetical protein